MKVFFALLCVSAAQYVTASGGDADAASMLQLQRGCRSGTGCKPTARGRAVTPVADIHFGTPVSGQAEVPTPSEYEEALKTLDIEQAKADMSALLASSKDWWPADYGNYGPFMVRLAWHCSGSFRNSDGVGGCGGGRQRFDPEASWPDNANLDKARALLAPMKKKYGNALSWGDLFILAGTTAYRDAGAPLTQMCFGRMDDGDGKKSEPLGPTALQAEKFPCEVNGNCSAPLGATTVGLVYVNPEGPMGNPDPALSVKDVIQTFSLMGHSDEHTVALIGGGHTIGKAHGACDKPGAGGVAPNEAYPEGELPWEGTCGEENDINRGRAENTVTSGFEGPWTDNPLQWDNQYFNLLMNYEWEKHKGSGGHWQWRIKNSDKTNMMLTADLALLHDDRYKKYVEMFAQDMDAFDAAFDQAWFALTTLKGNTAWSKASRCDSGDFPADLMNFMLDSDVTADVASSSLMSMVDESCEDASTGCKGGCYVGPSEAFFEDCMIGRSPVVGIIMKNPKLIAGDHCTNAGFEPLILPDNAGNTEPDGCYGGANSRVSFYTSDQAWFWEATASGFNPVVDCPAWQEANPTCFDTHA